jgi:hypothetical protein
MFRIFLFSFGFFFFGFCGGEGRGWRRRGYWPPDERGCGGAAMILRKRERVQWRGCSK